MSDDAMKPQGELATRSVAMPRDTNPNGDIFGGWLMSQMDIAGGVTADHRAKGRVATIAVEGMVLLQPVYVGDVVCCYADIRKIGTTSIAIHIEAWALRHDTGLDAKVTEGIFTYVAIDDHGRKRPVPPA
ncbi:MAG: acyl-CoA thioesterase [Rhodospirillales bacterium]|jgi:acyl-CoA thioesterase YciA|nr:acyl-CoA thioesterase [Rhodospirillales bacterium]